jgi:glycosyltransferase involved in cell wall biosynthesis
MKILIGMLVWNEEKIIAQTIKSLFSQNIFGKQQYEIELIVLANACTDSTAQVAQKQFDILVPKQMAKVEAKVISVKQAGKINAWNSVMFKHSKKNEQYIIFMDGDIIFQQEDNLSKLIQGLEEDSEAWISTDQPVKDISLLKKKNTFQKISLAFSKFTSKGSGQLCAQLYCARSSFLRRVALPDGLIIEDAFLKFIAVTNGLTEKANPKRVIKIEGISHLFEAYTGFKSYFKNQIRQTIAFTIWQIFKAEARRAETENAMEFSKEQYLKSPNWFSKIIQQNFQQKKFWHIYPGALTVRFKRLKRLSAFDRLKMLLPVMAASLLDLCIFVASNRKIKKGDLTNIWPDTESMQLAEIYAQNSMK